MSLADTYRDHLTTVMQRRKIPGAGVFLRRKDEVLFDEGVGLADREAGRPVTQETIFGIGSVTKSFTCVAIMQLVDSGKLKVTDPVYAHLPALRREGGTDLSGVTLHHLMSNSSGLPPLPFLARGLVRAQRAEVSKDLFKIDVDKLPEPIDSYDELVAAMAETDIELLAPPGTVFSYSNDGFALLGRIIELASGQSYTDYVHQHILEPLGMTRSLYDGERLLQMGDVTELYSYIDGFDRVEHTPGWWESPCMTSAGFLRSTARDMGKYAELFFGNRPDLLSPESLAAITSPHIVTGGDGRYYGYGVMVQPDYHGHKLVEHGGNIKGVAAYITMLPDLELVSVVLNNITGGPTGGLTLAGINLALGLPAEERRVTLEPVTVSDAAIEAMLGTFRSDEGATIQFVRDEDGSLYAQNPQARLDAKAVGEAKVEVDVNGDPALAYFSRRDEGGYQAVFFGFRILTRVQPTPEEETDGAPEDASSERVA